MEEVNKKKQDLLKQEEALVKKNRDLQKQAVKAKATTNSHNPNASVREAELQGEVDKCMVCIISIRRGGQFVHLHSTEYPEMFDVQDEHAKHCPNQVYAL